MLNKQDESINFKIEVDDEKLQDTVDILKEVNDSKPNITIRDNVNVYVTINNFNEPEREYLKEEKAFVYGAYNKQELVGFIWGYPHIFFDEKRIFINCLVVEKEYEKKGIGKKLINKINEYASKNKYDSIDLTVAPFNKNAVGFYEHIGFKSERVQMYKSIGEKKWMF